MKNIGLLVILISLVGIAYYFEEVQGKKKIEEYKDKRRLFKEFNQLTGIKTKNYELKNIGFWQVANLSYPADQRLINDFSLILGNINIVGEVTDIDEYQYFKKLNLPFTLVVGPNESVYQLGDVSELTGKFYVKRFGTDPKVFICQDDSRYTGTYKSDLDLALKKYLRLKNILMGQEDLFIIRKLFHGLNLEQIEKIKIDNKRNRWFEIDLLKNQTTPPKFSKIKYKRMQEVIHYLFENSLVKKLYGPGQHILSNPVSEVLFTFKSKQEMKAKLYAGLNDKFGYFVKFSNLDFIFELDESSAKLFYTHVQDYWNKRFLFNVNFREIDSFDFSIAKDGKKFYPFKVTDLKSFDIKALDPSVSSINKNLMNFLFNLLLNLVDFKEADHLEQLETIPSEGQIKVKLFGREFLLSILERGLEVSDLGAMIKYHFNYNTQQIQAETLSRIFTLQGN